MEVLSMGYCALLAGKTMSYLREVSSVNALALLQPLIMHKVFCLL